MDAIVIPSKKAFAFEQENLPLVPIILWLRDAVFLFLVGMFLIALVDFNLGGDYGVQNLFWHEDPISRLHQHR